jgi:hypothetical protein
MTYALTKAIPVIASKISPQLPADKVPGRHQLTMPSRAQILQLPPGRHCSLSTCFDELLALFAGDLYADAGGFTSGKKDDWNVFWMLILFLLFALFWLCQPDGMPPPEKPCAIRTKKRRAADGGGRGDGLHAGRSCTKTCFRKSAPNILSINDCCKSLSGHSKAFK